MKKINRKLILATMVIATLLCACNKPEPETPTSQILTDVDGNTYDTVRIGTQIWMSQDLKVKHFPNGIDLKKFRIGLKEPAYLDYGGKMLYNALAAQYGETSGNGHVQGICPDGWHLPTRAEWQQLTDYVAEHPSLWESSGSVSHAMESQQWPLPVDAALFNQTGFSALPTGYLISFPRHTELFTYEEQVEQRWVQRGNAYYWSADHNDDYPATYIPDDSPWAIPHWGWLQDDSLEVQSYVLLLNANQESPEFSSLPDIHYCAIRCVKD